MKTQDFKKTSPQTPPKNTPDNRGSIPKPNGNTHLGNTCTAKHWMSSLLYVRPAAT